MTIGLESIPSKPPTYSNGKIFYEYNQPSLNTDYTSSGEAYSKFRDSTYNIYNIPPNLMSSQNYINQTVLNNSLPYVAATYNNNNNAFASGLPLMTSSSSYPTYTSYNSSLVTVAPKLENSIGSQFSFIRPKKSNVAFINTDGSIDLTAMKNTFRPTNGVHFTDTPIIEPITPGLYASPKNNYLSMPINPNYPNTDASILVYHNNNSVYGDYPSNEYVKIIRNILPVINKNGFVSIHAAETAKKELINYCSLESSKTLVNDFTIVENNGKFYLLPVFS